MQCVLNAPLSTAPSEALGLNTTYSQLIHIICTDIRAPEGGEGCLCAGPYQSKYWYGPAFLVGGGAGSARPLPPDGYLVELFRLAELLDEVFYLSGR